MKYTLAVCSLVATVVAGQVCAAPHLQITEIYSGQVGSPDPTEDWFEVTNFGDMAWDTSVDGALYYDDDSMDPGTADLLSGVPVIAPGQTVVFVNGGPSGLADFLSAWSNVPGIMGGHFEGAGLGGGGDTVTLFTGDSNFPNDGISNAVILDKESYPSLDELIDSMSPELIDGASWDVELGAFSTVGNLAGAVTSQGVSSVTGLPELASPGSRIPEPASLVLFVTGLAAILRRVRK